MRITDLVTAAGHPHSAAYALHQSAHQFAAIGHLGVGAVAFIILLPVVVVLLVSGAFSAARR